MHNAVNELTARTVGEDPQISLTYDDAGNLTQDGSAEGDHQYVWDYRNRLIEVKEKQSGNWNTVGEYKYDARTRRVLKTVTNKGALNGTTRFLWGGISDWQCLEERNGDGDLVARYTYSPGYIDAVAVQERDLNADDDFGDAGEVVYYHSNTLFSVYALTDAGEDLVERYRYDAYGAATVLDADWAADGDGLSDVGNPYAFTGRRLDPESGLMQYRYRSYSHSLGRFVSRDPLMAQLTSGLYAVVAGRPTHSEDPSGLKSYHCCAEWGYQWEKEGFVTEDACVNHYIKEVRDSSDPFLMTWLNYWLGWIPMNVGGAAGIWLYELEHDLGLLFCTKRYCKDDEPAHIRGNWWGLCPFSGHEIIEWYCKDGDMYDVDNPASYEIDPEVYAIFQYYNLHADAWAITPY